MSLSENDNPIWDNNHFVIFHQTVPEIFISCMFSSNKPEIIVSRVFFLTRKRRKSEGFGRKRSQNTTSHISRLSRNEQPD